MVYFDTSVIATLLLRDSQSATVERTLARLDPDDFRLSAWLGVEVFSAIGRRARNRQIDARAAEQARQFFVDEFAAKHPMLPIRAEDYELAQSWLARESLGLRSGDALHLAIAHRHRVGTFYSFDKGLLKAARVLGIRCVSP